MTLNTKTVTRHMSHVCDKVCHISIFYRKGERKRELKNEINNIYKRKWRFE